MCFLSQENVRFDSILDLCMSVGFAIILSQQQKGSKMATPQIGETFTTAKSGVSGIVQEVVKNDNGSYRIRLSVNGQDRWTTAK